MSQSDDGGNVVRVSPSAAEILRLAGHGIFGGGQVIVATRAEVQQTKQHQFYPEQDVSILVPKGSCKT